jgi:hypothetical protein
MAVAGATAMLLAPSLGDYALIFLGAFFGCLHTVSRKDFKDDKWEATWYTIKWVGAAMILTGFVSSLLIQYTGFQADRWPGVIAFGITFLADKWKAWASELGSALVTRASGKPKDPT